MKKLIIYLVVTCFALFAGYQTVKAWETSGGLEVIRGEILGGNLNANNKEITNLKALTFYAASELTISSDAITVTQAVHTLDGAGDVDDDLVTINGGNDEEIILLRPANAARNITLKHGIGNIVIGTGSDYIIPDNGMVFLQYDGSNWRMVGGGFDPAAPGAIGGTTPAAGSFTTLTTSGDVTLTSDVTLGAAKHLVLPQHNDATTPTLAFGDGNTGFYEGADNTLKISVGGADKFVIEAGIIRGVAAGSASVLNEVSSSINPTLAPNRTDLDTGMGHATADQLSLIAGGVESQRITEASRTIEENATVGENDTTLRIVTTAVHGLKVDDVIQFAAGTGTLPTGITAATNYYVTAVDTNKKFHVSAARGGTEVAYTNTGTAFTSYELEITINQYGKVYPDIWKYIPAIEFEITTGTSADINGTGIHGHSMTDGELSTLSYKDINSLGLDVSRPINVQVVWCPIDGNTSNGVTWVVTYDHDAFESGVLTAPGTALDTGIAEDLENDTPYVIQKTENGIINAATLTLANAIAFKVEADVVDSGNDPGCWFMGLSLSQ